MRPHTWDIEPDAYLYGGHYSCKVCGLNFAVHRNRTISQVVEASGQVDCYEYLVKKVHSE